MLSEIPGDWYRAIQNWRMLTRGYKSDGAPTPDEEYLFYQTLAGIWDESSEMTSRRTAFEMT